MKGAVSVKSDSWVKTWWFSSSVGKYLLEGDIYLKKGQGSRRQNKVSREDKLTLFIPSGLKQQHWLQK